jgi:phosphatidylserine decarboxylase
MITKYGYFTIGAAVFVAAILIIIAFLQNNLALTVILTTLGLLLVLFTLNFFRDPDRTTPKDDHLVISPADGKVLFVKDVQDTIYIKGKARQVSIFMSPLNVHVNRIPISGTVEYLNYHKGKYIAAFEDKASEVNERSEFGIRSKFGKVFFTQVAGFVARRIIYDLKEGQSVIAGKRFGMIKFGSRVDVIVPYEWEVMVTKNDLVTAGETILFRIPK